SHDDLRFRGTDDPPKDAGGDPLRPRLALRNDAAGRDGEAPSGRAPSHAAEPDARSPRPPAPDTQAGAVRAHDHTAEVIAGEGLEVVQERLSSLSRQCDP